MYFRFYEKGGNWVGEQFKSDKFPKILISIFENSDFLKDMPKLSNIFYFVFLFLLLLKVRKKKFVFFIFLYFLRHHFFKKESTIYQIRLKSLQKNTFFTHETISACNDISTGHLKYLLRYLSLNKLTYRNKNK